MEQSTITVTVPGVDADVVRRLKNLAAQNNRTLESELRGILEKAIANDAEAMAAKRKAFRQQSRELLKLTAGKPQIPAEVLIRQDRDSDHGRLPLPPLFASEAEERAFWETHDSTEYVDWDNAQLVTFPNLRLSSDTETASAPTADAAVVEQPA